MSQCGNWREIMRLSIASKVPTKVILERMKEARNSDQSKRSFARTDHTQTTLPLFESSEQSTEW